MRGNWSFGIIEKSKKYREKKVNGNMGRTMRKRMNQALALLLLGGMLGSAGACGKTETTVDNTGEPGWQKYAGEPIDLDWYVNYSWFATPWGGNLVSDTITEETGVDINFITPMGNETEKLNALIASDSLPDIITLGWWEPQVSEMITGDMVYALNELADEYDPHFWQVSDPDVVNWFTQEDGNIYGYPNSATTPQDIEENDNIKSNETFLVRKDIYEAIGSPDMSTREGFATAVKKAVELFPTVDGKSLIPIGSQVFDNEGCVSFDKHLMDFLAVPWEKDGTYYDRYTDPDYIKWLKLYRQLGEEGYLANDIFVDTRTQMEEKLKEGRYFCMIYQYADILEQEKYLNEHTPERIYIAVDGPKNDAGDDYTLPTSSVNGWTVTMISKNCKDPKRAISFLDYMMSERGQKLIYLGVEGETYDMVDGKAVLKKEVKELLDSDQKTYDEVYGGNDAYWMLQDNVMQLKWQVDAADCVAQMEEWTYPYAVYNGQYDMILPAGSEVANIDDKATKLWSTTLPKLLLADSEEAFDNIYQDFVTKRTDLGYDHVLEEKTKLMEEAKEKLGMK